jgi:protein phosphatase
MVAALVLVALTGFGAYTYARSRAYLIDESGYVALYRGIPGSVSGLSLSWKVESTDIAVGTLAIPARVRLQEGIPYAGLSQAQASVSALRAESTSASVAASPSVTATAPPAP